MSNDTSKCPVKYLKLRKKILELSDAETPAGGKRRSLIKHLKSQHPLLWKSVSDPTPPCALLINNLYEILDLPTKRLCLGGCGRTLTLCVGSGRGGICLPKHCSHKCSANDPKTIQRRHATHRERTGYDHNMQSPLGLKRWQDNYKAKTGYTNPFQNPKVKDAIDVEARTEKSASTHYARYNCRNPNQRPEIQRMKAERYFQKTGYHSPSQNPEVFEKQQRASKKIKVFTSKTGKNFFCRGYEPYVLNFLDNHPLVKSFTTKVNTTRLPTLTYQKSTGKTAKYYPDIGVVLRNGRHLVIEVKSNHTLWCDADNNRRKFRAASAWCRSQRDSKFWLVVVNPKLGSLEWKC